MDLLRIATAGSVDDGKSTLIGRLLYDSKAILEDQMGALERARRQRGDTDIDLALLTDGLRAEREQGITIDVAYRYFTTARRKFIIADTPGHLQYTRNMVTGASTAQLAIVLVDARKGIVTQSRRHGFLSSLLQIPHLVVAINKMDLVGYREEVYRDIADAYQEFAARLAAHSLTFVPISALRGDNVVNASQHMPWYCGPSLLHYLETVPVPDLRSSAQFRFPVQLAIRPHQDFRGFAGQVASGEASPGDEIVVLPSGRATRIRSIVSGGETAPSAAAGDSIVLTLDDEIDISRGDLIVHRDSLPESASEIECTLCWLNEEALDPTRSYQLQHTTRLVSATVTAITCRIDVDTLHEEPAASLALNEIGQVRIRTARPLHFDPYTSNRATGSFILIDPHSNNTVAAGLIRSAVNAQRVRLQSSNVFWSDAPVTTGEREIRNRHQAAVLWFTGLSGSGKSTLANLLERRLFALGCQTFHLDGDNVRHGLNGDLGFSAADRQENIRRVAEVARLAFDHGQIVLCAFISPLRSDRAAARALLPPGRFVEIYTQCELDECVRRDTKGLYARAIRGDIADFTGISSPYEVPDQPELVLATDKQTPAELVDLIVAELQRSGILQPAPIEPA